MPGWRVSARKEIRQRGESIITDTEAIISKLDQLEVYAREHKRPHMHFHSFRKDLETFVDQFQRMLR